MQVGILSLTLMFTLAFGRTVHVQPGDDVQGVLDENPAGTLFQFAPGLYERCSLRVKDNVQLVGPKPAMPAIPSNTLPVAGLASLNFSNDRMLRQTLEAIEPPIWRAISETGSRQLDLAYGAAVFRGSVRLSNFSTPAVSPCTGIEGRAFQVVDGLVAQPTWAHGKCQPQYPACNMDQHILFNHSWLGWHSPNMSAFCDAARGAQSRGGIAKGIPYLVQYADPSSPYSNATVWVALSAEALDNYELDLAVDRAAIRGDASGVVVENIVIDGYANPAQAGAIIPGKNASRPGPGNWSIRGVEVRNCHGAGLSIASGSTATGCFLHHNGQQGAHGGNGSILSTEIAFNNMAGFRLGWEAGGGKFGSDCTFTTVSGCFSHSNYGDGLWTDVGGRGIQYTDNIIVNNTGAGISHEISYPAIIANNTIFGNGRAMSVWLWDAQIQVQNSFGVRVLDNVVKTNESTGARNWLAIINQNRTYAGKQFHALNNTFAGNVVDTQSPCKGNGGMVADHFLSLVAGHANEFDRNTYLMAGEGQQLCRNWEWVLPANGSQPAKGASLSWVDFREVAGQELGGRLVPAPTGAPQCHCS